MRFFPVIAVASALLSACEHDVAPSGPTVIQDDGEQAVTFAVPADLESERVYLGSTNWVHQMDISFGHIGVFDLSENAKVLIELTDVNAWLPVGFNVYRVTATGALYYLGTLDGWDGYAAAILTSKTGGSYVVESFGDQAPATLALDLTCRKNNGKCSPNLQPDTFCGSRGAGGVCDEGLFCNIAEGCGYDDRGGTCRRPVQMCPAVYGPAVCGCDGKTYSTGCVANSAGVNVNYQGECPCDGTVFQKNLGDMIDVAGTWIWKGPFGESDITSTLTLRADGTFHYQQVWDPKCLHVEPYCRRASLLFGMSGTWENQIFAVQLTPVVEPDLELPLELAQSFGIETNCEGTTRLNTTELDQERTLERDRCADLSCADGEHCEMVQVQCIQAPCFPVAMCVAG